MKILKIILWVVLGIIGVFLLVAVFLPSEYSVERSITIEKPAELVFSRVADFNYYNKWNPWSRTDPGIKTAVSGEPAKPGSKWEWDGELVGKGSMEILSLVEGKSILSKLTFFEPQQGEASDKWTFKPEGNGTEATWQLTGKAEYPVGRYFGLMMDNLLGNDFENGLKSLKELCENEPDSTGNIKIISEGEM